LGEVGGAARDLRLPLKMRLETPDIVRTGRHCVRRLVDRVWDDLTTRWTTKVSAPLNLRVLRDQVCTTKGPRINCARQVDLLRKGRTPPGGYAQLHSPSRYGMWRGLINVLPAPDRYAPIRGSDSWQRRGGGMNK